MLNHFKVYGSGHVSGYRGTDNTRDPSGSKNFEQLVKFSALWDKDPDWLSDLFCELDDDPETRKLIAATVAAEQCRQLQSYGFKEFHFYTLNRADSLTLLLTFWVLDLEIIG